jgi:uncharacterized protein
VPGLHLLEVVCVNFDAPAAIRRWLQACLLTVVLLLPLAPALAVSATAFSDTSPQERVLDQADVLSRAASADVSRQLETLSAERVDAHLITLKQLDYGLSLQQLGQDLLQRWQQSAESNGQLLFLIDAQTNTAAVVASPSLSGQLSANLLRSTARTTMAAPIRDGARFRQASLDGIQRITTVLQGGEDPGEPAVAQVITPTSNVPSREQTESSNGFTWVVVLLVVGTVVPMATWWVFSR